MDSAERRPFQTRYLGYHFRELYTEVVRVPMTGSADSLNMGVAASIVLHETASQRARPRPGG